MCMYMLKIMIEIRIIKLEFQKGAWIYIMIYIMEEYSLVTA